MLSCKLQGKQLNIALFAKSAQKAMSSDWSCDYEPLYPYEEIVETAINVKPSPTIASVIVFDVVIGVAVFALVGAAGYWQSH